MGKTLIFFIPSLFLSLSVYAHRPTAVKIEPDFESGKVKIVITHPVSNPRKRYVKTVEITVDDNTPIVKRFFFQIGDKRTLTVDVPDLKRAKKITVKAYCNRGGSIQKEFDLDTFRKETEE